MADWQEKYLLMSTRQQEVSDKLNSGSCDPQDFAGLSQEYAEREPVVAHLSLLNDTCLLYTSPSPRDRG